MVTSPLFERFSLGNLELKNRIAMAPMTREMAPGGVPTAEMAEYYARRAAGGVGLIITEGVSPADEGAFGSAVPRLFGDDALAAWRRVVDAVHADGAAIFAQIWHVGSFSPSLIGMQDSMEPITRVSPSGLAAEGRPLGRAMSLDDVENTIEQFATACANAKAVGFDGVELHGAHGYLVDQFLWPATNRRNDRYGGSSENRASFAIELVKRIRQRTSADFPIALRLSQWKQLDYKARLADDADALERIVVPLAEAGVDLFHCSTRRFWEPEFEGDPRNLGAWVKSITGKPVITVGSVTLDVDFKAPTGKVFAAPALEHIRLLEEGIKKGWFDLVAIGRALIANPDWPQLVAAGRANKLRSFDRKMLDRLH